MERLNNLKDDDLITLSYLYLYRAMNVEQLMRYVYKVDTSNPSGKRSRTMIVKRLMEQGVATKTEYQPGSEALQITNQGIDIVRYTRDIPHEVFDENTKAVKRGYYTASDLNLNNRLINHQVHLNQFMLEFEEEARSRELIWEYSDEKFLSQFVHIRPDGMISMMGYDLFLEMDMATESSKQLIEKWEGYRNFTHTHEFSNKPRKIMTLFICDNIVSKNKLKNRIKLVKNTIIDSGLINQMNHDFDIFVGSRKDCLRFIFDTIFLRVIDEDLTVNTTLKYMNDIGMTISHGSSLIKLLQGEFYHYYIRELDKNKRVKTDGSIRKEFFVDFYTQPIMSVLHRMDWYKKKMALYKDRLGRNIRLIIVVNDLNEVFPDLHLLGHRVFDQSYIYFLPLNRLDRSQPIHNNLYHIQYTGEVYQLATTDLSRYNYTYTIKDKSIKFKEGRVNEN